MSEPQPTQAVFRALADPTRRAILELLADKSLSVGDIVGHFNVTRPAVAKHLKILREGGLVDVRRDGREQINILRPEALRTAQAWIALFDRFWNDKFQILKNAVEANPE